MNNYANWYCLYIKPRSAKLVQKHLEHAEVESFSPEYRQKVIRGGNNLYKKKELFPNYLFVRCCESQIHMIKYTRGVVKFISDGGGKPYPIDEKLINAIKNKMNNGVVEINSAFKAGERVKVVDGSFKDFEGIFLEEKSPSERVILLLNTITLNMKVEMERDKIKSLSRDVV